MANLAQSSVFMSSDGSCTKHHKQVSGPTDFTSLTSILASMQTVGFQAAHYAKAGRLMAQMLQQQPPSKIFAIQDGNFVEVPPAATPEATTLESGSHEPEKIYPNIFLGMTANLLGTGCREGLRFLVEEGVRPRTVAATPAEAAEIATDFERLIRQLVQSEGLPSRCMALRGDHHSFLAALVVSGGGMEHDLRRACQPYTLTHYRSEAEANVGTSSSTSSKDVHFGNISYTDDVAQHHHDLHHSAKTSYPSSCLFSILMRLFVGRLMARQERLRAEYRRTNTSGAAADVGTVCPWAIAPCEVWALAGLWLVDLLTEALMEHHAATSASDAMDETLRTRLATEAEARARTTITYWAAHKAVPVFSPSIADGDLITFVLEHTAAHPGSASLKLDLVRDIHHINKLAMLSQCTGMIICGGGVVKHHVCNANLMRNGADYTVILSTGQEFDGSDAGARPEEAISWGKVRIDGQSVKVYGEVTTMFPMLIAQVFVEAVRQRRAEAAATISTTE